MHLPIGTILSNTYPSREFPGIKFSTFELAEQTNSTSASGLQLSSARRAAIAFLAPYPAEDNEEAGFSIAGDHGGWLESLDLAGFRFGCVE